MRQKIEFANTLRGYAALSVVVSHYFYAFWIVPKGIGVLINAPALDLARPGFTNWIERDPYFSWGPFGVALFFLISGFVIPFSLNKMSLRGFCLNRLLRIFPTYAVGFTITLLALRISGAHFGRPWPFADTDVLLHYLPGIRDVMNVKTIDGIIWTLDIEMKFYVLCALCIALFRRRSIAVFIAPATIFLAAMSGWSWLSTNANFFDLNTVIYYYSAVNAIIDCQFIVFMFIGVVFHYLYTGAIKRDQAIVLVSMLFALYILANEFGPDRYGSVLLLNYVWALMVFAFAYRFQRFFAANRVTDFLAKVSYPLYVSHGIAGYVALRLMLDHGIHARVALPVTTAGALGLAYVIHRLVEMPSQRLASAVSRRAVKADAEERQVDRLAA